MTANEISSLFGESSNSSAVENLYSALNTLRRPSLPEDEEYIFHDWVLVRRKGVELGFADSEYQKAAPRYRWGGGELLLTQAYFYRGFGDIQPYAGNLPHGLTFSDTPEIARQKLSAFESTRHSYRNDTWDVDSYRLSVTYTENRQGIDRLACRQLAAPIPREGEIVLPSLSALTGAFGCRITDREFSSLWGEMLDDNALSQGREYGEIDFTRSFGATIGLAGGNFRSITLHRNRDTESAGWCGPLPHELNFEDSPETLFAKMPEPPVQKSDSALTGHGVWHFPDYTVHILYSNLDNRLLRVKLIAPGSWKCIEES